MRRKRSFGLFAFFLLSILGVALASDTSLGQVHFDTPINLSDSHGVNWSAELAAVEGQTVVYWLDYVYRPRGAIRLAHSKDKGQTFRTWNLSPGIELPYPPTAVADKESVYVGWTGLASFSDLRSTGIFLARSNDRGESFEPPFDITGRGGFGTPIMRIRDGILNVVWVGGTDRDTNVFGVFFSKSTDWGKSFSEPTRVALLPGPWALGTVPELALGGDQIYVVWKGGKPDQPLGIYFARSRDVGNTFDEPIDLSRLTRDEDRTNGPQLAIGGPGYIYAAWSQGWDQVTFPPPYDIYFARSTDGGVTFSKPLNLSNNAEASHVNLRMVAAGNNIYAVWSGLVRGADQIFFARSTDGGQTFSKPQNISRNPGFMPELALDEGGTLAGHGITGNYVYLTWYGVSQGHAAIFYSLSLDSGATFSEPQVISDTQRFSALPHIAAVGSDVYLTWRQGPYDSDAIFIHGQLEELNNRGR